ncbi:cellulose biosynthesis protein BcsQ [Rheinheimera sp.]|uniref:cellulose biosynthesis protein BcsQ n=1 Tax=Rheinheimera sp. TaxID=1869214 RepID=UPI00307CF2A6
MNLICVASPKGGVGKTTLTANLAHALQRLGLRVLVIDFDPQNSLRLHFGMPLSDSSGHVKDWNAVQEWSHHVRESDSGVRYVPYGRVQKFEKDHYEQTLAKEPKLLATWLAPFISQPELVVIADLAPGYSVAMQALCQFDPIILNVLLADSASLSSLPEIESGNLYGEDMRDRCYYIVNQVDVRSQLNADVTSFLTQRLGSALLGTVHRDEAVAEANANQMLVFKYSQASAVAADFDAIAKNLHRLLPKAIFNPHKKSI